MHIEVRHAGKHDLEILHELLAILHGKPPWNDDATGRARATLDAIIMEPLRGLLIAELEGEPVGTIDVIVSTNLTRDVRPLALIENIVVKPDLRRLGLGRRLVQAALDFAEANDCYKVQLVSANKRDAAHHLYRAMGFDADVSGFRRYLISV